MIKYVNEEPSWESYTIDNDFNWFPSNDDEENFGYVDEYEDPKLNVIWDTEESIINLIDNFNPSEIDSKIQEFKPSDWPFDFWSYQDWLDKLPEDLKKDIDDYVHREYSKFFEKDEEVGWIEPMESTDDYLDQDEQKIPRNAVRHWNRSHKSKGKPSYNELDDYSLAA